jgi:exopolyphosphatase/guanosine-5'-triphosphate,3'-diphosphate pyrophosphatase
MNPDSGEKPPEGGASAAGRPGGKPGRRRKAKRSGKQPSADVAARGAEAAQARDPLRPDARQDDSPVRKRKRRRSRGGARKAGNGQPRPDQAGVEAAAERSVSQDPALTNRLHRTEAGNKAAGDKPVGPTHAMHANQGDGHSGPSEKSISGSHAHSQHQPNLNAPAQGASRKGPPQNRHPTPSDTVSTGHERGQHGARPADHAHAGHSAGQAAAGQVSAGRTASQPHAAGQDRTQRQQAQSQAGQGRRGGSESGPGSADPMHAAEYFAQPAGQDPHGSAAAPGHDPGEPRPSGSGRRRGRNKKNREGRGLQGRPLVPSAKPPAGKPHGAHSPHAAHGGAPATGRSVNGAAIPARSATATGTRSGGQDQRPRPHASTEIADQGRRRAPDDLYAALDLGTNNCRLLIAQPTRPGQFRVVDAFSRIVRLGEGLAATGRLSEEAMDRAVEALKICAAKLANRPVRKMRLIATEACRAASNGEAFLERVTREAGLQLEIIDRETEARLAVSGCSSLVGREARSVVLFDIGGGSSEIAVIRISDSRSSRLANHITHWTSLPVGVVTLSERHGGRDVTPAVFSAMVTEVETMLEDFECPPVGEQYGRADADFHLIGTSGTVTTLAGVHLDLPRYDRRKVDGLWLTDDEVTAMQAKLLSWDFEGRAANPCIGPDRADLVLAGCAILEAIRRRWPSTRMRVADRGLREGLLTDMMADDGVWRRMRRRPADGGSHSTLEIRR